MLLNLYTFLKKFAFLFMNFHILEKNFFVNNGFLLFILSYNVSVIVTNSCFNLSLHIQKQLYSIKYSMMYLYFTLNVWNISIISIIKSKLIKMFLIWKYWEESDRLVVISSWPEKYHEHTWNRSGLWSTSLTPLWFLLVYWILLKQLTIMNYFLCTLKENFQMINVYFFI